MALSRIKSENFFKKNALILAILTSALFILHPVQTQTVSYVIQGQLEGLAGLFVIAMTTIFLAAQYTESFTKKTLLTILLFVLAVLSCGTKEIAIVSPMIILLTDWFFVAQGNWGLIKSRWWIHAIVYLSVFMVYIYFLKPEFFSNLLTLSMEARNNIGNVLTENQTDKILPFHYFISEFKVIIHYIWIFLWPLRI